MIRWVSAEDFHNRLDAGEWRRVAATFLFVALPLFFFLPTELGMLLAAGVVLKFVALAVKNERFALGAALVLMFVGCSLVYSRLHSVGMTMSFVAMLVTMSVCKLLEARNRRDVHVLFLLQMLLMLAFLMYSQSIPMFLYLLFTLVISLRGLLRFEQLGRARVQFARWRDVVRMFAIALPFAAAMFFLFPRVQPLWGMPQQSGAKTGLPEEMHMGDLSSLAQSNEIAFRVRFLGDSRPDLSQLYWRGPVLWFFDGIQWHQRPGEVFNRPPRFSYRENSVVRYELTPVKKTLRWLTVLDLPLNLPTEARAGYAWQVQMPITPRGVTANRFEVSSALSYRMEDALPARDRKDALQLPHNYPMPQTEGLARRLFQENGGDTRGFANAFLAYLRNNEFYYTLEPPPGAGNPESFLFGNRMGFCEHYTNAMVLAARSVGIPARVVIGYQGGEPNSVSGDWAVREEAAHAWAELWIDGEGWVRFDPTAAVAPERILQGRISGGGLEGEDSRSLTSRIAETLGAVAWLRDALEATQAFWQDWVIDLDRDQQQSILRGLGLQNLGAIGLLFILVPALLIGAALLYWFWHNRPRHDEDAVARLLRRRLARWAKRGYVKDDNESVAVFFRRLAQNAPPPQAAQLQAAAADYEALRYRENGNASQLIDLIKRIRL